MRFAGGELGLLISVILANIPALLFSILAIVLIVYFVRKIMRDN